MKPICSIFRRMAWGLIALVFGGQLMLSVSARSDLAAVSDGVNLALASESCILKEAYSGETVYEKNADEPLEPASVTKIMSVLLVCEALDGDRLKLTDTVTASAYAASMGGSQIWLEQGEQMSVDDMLKAVVVASANDCTVALAEHVCGSEEAFVASMNKRAEELGMTDTHFVNCTGLPASGHVTTARDIAVMTAELLKHDTVLAYTGIWMDSVRGGKMGLTNTNKLVRFYPGANGMKTGYTDSAKYCLSATAKRDGVQWIAVTLKAPTSDERFQDAKKMLDFGFANFSLYTTEIGDLPKVYVRGGITPEVELQALSQSFLIAKGREGTVRAEPDFPASVDAPLKKGDTVGKIRYLIGDKPVAEIPVTALQDVPRVTFSDVLKRLCRTTACFLT